MQTAAPVKATPTAVVSAGSLTIKMARKFGVDEDKLMRTLKATAFRQRADKQGQVREVSNEEMMALLVIADQYGLNPFTREIFAFFDVKSGAIVPVVSVDGWLRIINERPELRSIEFTGSGETIEHKGKVCHVWMECEIGRSDRVKPISIREYFAEVVRKVDYATPWDSHPNRMHRHKTLIQCARVAFGFSGIYDEDEAARIIEGEAARVPETPKAIASINAAIKPPIDGEAKREPEATTQAAPTDAPDVSFAKLIEKMQKTTDVDVLDADADLIRLLPEGQQKDATIFYKQRRDEIESGGAETTAA